MKDKLKNIIGKASVLLKKIQKYAVFVFLISIFSVYGFLIFQIGRLSQYEPDEAAVKEQLNTVKRLKIDQNTIDKIEQLEDQNVSVQSLFKSARDNPFQDN